MKSLCPCVASFSYSIRSHILCRTHAAISVIIGGDIGRWLDHTVAWIIPKVAETDRVRLMQGTEYMYPGSSYDKVQVLVR